MHCTRWFARRAACATAGPAQTITKDGGNQTVTRQMQGLTPHIGGQVQISALTQGRPKGPPAIPITGREFTLKQALLAATWG